MDNGNAVVWDADVRFLRRRDEVIVVHLAGRSFVKIEASALPYVESAMSEGAQAVGARLSDQERAEFLRLMDVLREDGYLVEKAGVVPVAAEAMAEREFLEWPKTAYYAASDGCNLTCPFCYASAKRRQSPYVGDTETSKRIIDRLAEFSVQNLILSGGEPLLREDLYELVAYAKQRIRAVGLVTNGVLLGPMQAEKLRAAGADFVQVSVESSDGKEHDALRGAGTFETCVSAIEHLKAEGFKKEQLFVTATITSGNIDGLAGLAGLADRLGATPGASFFQPVGRGHDHRDELMCDDKRYLRYFFGSMQRQKLACAQDGVGAPDASASDALVPAVRVACGIGHGTIGVKEDGTVVPCHLFFSFDEWGLGNILDEGTVGRLVALAASLPTIDSIEGCKDCDVRYFCGGGCWAAAYWENGAFGKRNPHCSFYKKYYSSIIWNLGKENEMEAIYRGLEQATGV